MPAIKITAILPFDSGLPRDTAENTFFFEPAGGPIGPEQFLTAITAVHDFYVVSPPGHTDAVSSWLSPAIDRGADACTIRAVLIDPTTGHEDSAATLVPFTARDSLVSSGYPNEVSVCMSYHATWANPTEKRRRRGRIFLGPLVGNAGTMPTGASGPVPATALMSVITDAATRLLTDAAAGVGTGPGGLVGAPCDWSVYSRTDHSVWPIVGGYVDNEFDTQRRRGLRATSRVTF